MESNEFSINKKTRESLNKTTKIYRFSYGIGIFVAGVILFMQFDEPLPHKYSILSVGMILLGISFSIYGYIGKKIFAQKIQIHMDDESIIIKESFKAKTSILLDSITYIKFLPFGIEFSFSDYSKTFDFSLLSQEEFNEFKVKLTEYCTKKNIEVE